MNINFTKMHGLGNDFIIITSADAKARAAITSHARLLADRRWGVGCDQILLIDAADDTGGDGAIALTIVNSDGSVAEACGNGTRCVADLVMRERRVDSLTIHTAGGILRAWREGGMVAVTMGTPRFDWQDIPLAQASNTSQLQLIDGLSPAMAINLGNPHVVFAVEDAEAVDVARVGSAIETHALFPQRTNAEFITLIAKNKIRMRVWERGAGITSACGSGAVASAVAAHRLGLVDRQVAVMADGGELHVHWQEDDETILIGPATLSFYGSIALDSKRAQGT